MRMRQITTKQLEFKWASTLFTLYLVCKAEMQGKHTGKKICQVDWLNTLYELLPCTRIAELGELLKTRPL